MNTQHIILALLWGLYAFLHSFLAADFFKRGIMRIMGNGYKYYRFLYAIFALLSLITILIYHVQVTASPLLWKAPVFQKAAAIIAGVSGGIIMLICARVYFAEMMGLHAFSDKSQSIGLVQTGLHKYTRHPLYAGTLLFIWAFFLYSPTLKNLISCAVNTLYVFIGIWLEEKKLIATFGDTYRKYAAKTPMFFFRFW